MTKTFEFHGVQITREQYDAWYEERDKLQKQFDGVPEIQYISYPITPIQIPITRRMVYPKRHGFCFWCGRKLKGRKRHYCSDKHGRFYGFWFSWRRVRMSIFSRDKGTCQECGKKELWFEKRTDLKEFNIDDLGEIDHIIAIANGGSNWDLANLQLLCRKCHINKTRKDIYVIRDSPLKDQLELTQFMTSK